MAKSIPEVKIGNETYEIKDRTAREHLVEIKDGTTPPESPDNRLWIKPRENSYLVPEYSEFEELAETVEDLDSPFLTEEEIEEICGGGDS